jgi:hypothetical protein
MASLVRNDQRSYHMIMINLRILQNCNLRLAALVISLPSLLIKSFIRQEERFLAGFSAIV